MLGKPVPDFSLPSFLSQRQRSIHSSSLSDGDEALRQLFGVINVKNMYRRKVRGIERSTFVADEKRRLPRQWRGVKVPGHVQEVSNFVKAL